MREPYVGVSEAADLAGLSERQVRTLIANGSIKVTRVAGRILFSGTQLETLVELAEDDVADEADEESEGAEVDQDDEVESE